MFQGCFEEILRVFQGRLRGVPRDPEGLYKGAERVSKRISKGVLTF